MIQCILCHCNLYQPTHFQFLELLQEMQLKRLQMQSLSLVDNSFSHRLLLFLKVYLLQIWKMVVEKAGLYFYTFVTAVQINKGAARDKCRKIYYVQ